MDILNIYVIIHLTDTNEYVIKYHMILLVFNKKFMNFAINEVELLKFEGSY